MDITNDDIDMNLINNVISGVASEVEFISNNKSGMVRYMPQNGMEFETKEAAYAFYREYARSVGFGITIKSSRRSKKSGKFIDIKIACSKFGHKRHSATANTNPKACSKTDCKASMHIKKYNPEGKWFIYGFVEEHNHETCPDDFFSNAMRGKGKNDNSNVIRQKKGLQLALSERDVNLLLNYFMNMQAEAPGFHYAIDFDEKAQMRNVFWVNPKGRRDYIYFSDVVFLDTHYIRSKYNIPFVPIIGVNHHLQFILLGCALIKDEKRSTFIWLMNTWLRAVGGHSPRVIITDNHESLKEATAEVFPRACHCFCLWYLFDEVGQNLSQKMTEFHVFLAELKECVYGSRTEEEFEKRWKKMVNKFNLSDDKFMQSLYGDRRKWVPSYTRNVFHGGFCTVERAQSVVSYFDRYVHKETTFDEFIHQLKLFLREISEDEAKAESETRHGQQELFSCSPFEMQMSKIYTLAIYKYFQAEVSGILSCTVAMEGEDEKTVTYRVDDIGRKQSFTVSWNKRKHDVCCLCHLFESRGFLCSHALSVLQLSGVFTVPPKYILERWAKDAKVGSITRQELISTNFRIQRLNDLCKLAVEVGEKGSLSGEAYLVAFGDLEETLKRCVDMRNSLKSNPGLLPIGQRKEKPKKKKIRAEAEKLSTGIHDGSQDEQLNLNQRSHSLPDSYIYQQGLEGMEFGTRMPIINGYYNAEHDGHELLGHLNALPSLHGYYYTEQPFVQGVLGNQNSVSTCQQSSYPTKFAGTGI